MEHIDQPSCEIAMFRATRSAFVPLSLSLVMAFTPCLPALAQAMAVDPGQLPLFEPGVERVENADIWANPVPSSAPVPLTASQPVPLETLPVAQAPVATPPAFSLATDTPQVQAMSLDGVTRTLMAYPAQSGAVLNSSLGIDTSKIDLEKFVAMVDRQDYQEVYNQVATLYSNRDAFNNGQFKDVSYYRVEPPRPAMRSYASSGTGGSGNYGLKTAFVTAAVIGGGVAALSSGGGGGGSSGGGSGGGSTSDVFNRTALPTIATPASFQTSEMSNFKLDALNKENAHYAYAKGLTGVGVTIGFHDFFSSTSSADPELSTRITYRNLNIAADTAFMASDCALFPGDQEACNHGGAVMSYAAAERNNTGLFGVAPKASIMMNSVFATNVRNLADQNPDIINFSCGGSGCAVLGDLQYIAGKGILMTSATGNSNGSDPDPSTPASHASVLDYSLIAVSGVYNVGSTITSTGYDRCGSQMEYCMVAYSDTGTSFAAPQIAGAAALIKQGWSFLTPKQIAKILLYSAKDLGATGVDAIYGHGLLDLKAAVEPIGALSMLNGQGVTSNFMPSQVAMNQTSAFGDAFASSKNAKGDLVIVDAFGRDFKVPVRNNLVVAQTQTLSPSTLHLLGKRNNPLTARINDNLSMQFSQQENANGGTDMTGIAEYKTGNGTSLKLGFANDLDNIPMDDAQGFEKTNFISTDVFRNGFVNVSDNNQVLYQAVQFNDTGRLKTKVSAIYSKEGTQDYFQPRLNMVNSDYATTMVENSFKATEKTRLNFKTGITNESDSILGAKFSGGFDMAGGANTYFTGMDASYDVTPDINLSASYNYGVTKVKPSAASAFNDVSDLTSDSFFVTASKRNLLGHDNLSFSLGQPTRVRSGTASGLTQSVDPDTGAVSTAKFQQSLVPTGQTFMFQAAYGKDLSDDISMNLAFEYTTQPYQQKESDADIAGLAKMIYKFQ